MPKSKRLTVQDLFHRATQGKVPRGDDLFHPSDVYKVLKDPFWIWCKYHAPKEEAVEEASRYDEMKRQGGVEYEMAWIKEHYPDYVEIQPQYGLEAFKNTCKAMIEGVHAIYQPQLWDLGRNISGKSDLLVRDNRHGSDLGPYHYRVVEIKASRTLQNYHTLQAGFYNRMLGRMQGMAPEDVTIALKESIEQANYPEMENELDGILLEWKALRDGKRIPEPGRPPDVTESPWKVYGRKFVEAEKHLVLLAEVNAKEREKLRKAGIHRIDQLWDLTCEAICEMIGDHYGITAYNVSQAYKFEKPLPKADSPLVIPRAKRHLYFDFETSDEVHPTQPPHVYLIGLWDAEKNQFVHFLARGAEDEERIFREFMNYVPDLASTKLYHWTNFEIGEMRKVIERWPGLEGPLNKLFESCVDLKEVIKRAFYLPVPTYSIKSVAPALGFDWKQEAFGAFDSMVCYWDYLDSGDDQAIKKAIRYNKDDCLAMFHVDQVLAKTFA